MKRIHRDWCIVHHRRIRERLSVSVSMCRKSIFTSTYNVLSINEVIGFPAKYTHKSDELIVIGFGFPHRNQRKLIHISIGLSFSLFYRIIYFPIDVLFLCRDFDRICPFALDAF